MGAQEWQDRNVGSLGEQRLDAVLAAESALMGVGTASPAENAGSTTIRGRVGQGVCQKWQHVRLSVWATAMM